MSFIKLRVDESILQMKKNNILSGFLASHFIPFCTHTHATCLQLTNKATSPGRWPRCKRPVPDTSRCHPRRFEPLTDSRRIKDLLFVILSCSMGGYSLKTKRPYQTQEKKRRYSLARGQIVKSTKES